MLLFFFIFARVFEVLRTQLLSFEFLVGDPFLSKVVFSQYRSIWAEIFVEMCTIVDENTC